MRMTMGTGMEKATKIYWSHEERAKVLRAAAALALDNPNHTPLQLARLGQKVLEEDREREIMSLAMSNWTWFTDALPAEIERARADREAADKLSVSVCEAMVAPEPAVPEPEVQADRLSVIQEQVDSMLLEVLSQERADRAEAWGRLDARLGALEATIGAAVNRLVDVLGGGFTFTMAPLGRVPAPVAAPPPVPVPPPTVLEAPGTGFAPIRVPAPAPVARPVPAPAAAPPPPAIVPPGYRLMERKPNVVVLSVESGHTKNGIKEGVKDHVDRLDFWEVPNRPVGFANYDYIVCTKKTPTAWIETAKDGPWKEKVRTASGSARRSRRSSGSYHRSRSQGPGS